MKINPLFLFILHVILGCKSVGQSAKKDNGDYLRVLSYNIHHANPPAQPGKTDLEAIAKEITALQPDLAGIQEVDVYTGRSGKNLDQVKELGRLTGMQAFFCKTIDYDGGEYGIAILTKLPVTFMEKIKLPTEEHTGGEPRAMLVMGVNFKGKSLVFATTHLDARKSDTNRLLQIDYIINYFRNHHADDEVILVGDFNAIPDSQVIKRLDSSFKRSCLGGGCAPTYPQVHPVQTIDYIAYSGKKLLKLVDHKVIASADYASDHLPVFAAFELKK